MKTGVYAQVLLVQGLNRFDDGRRNQFQIIVDLGSR